MRLQQVDRQLSLQYADVVENRLRCLPWKPDNVACKNNRACLLPRQQHLAILRNLVLLLLRAQQASGIDAFKPDEYSAHTGASSFLNKLGEPVTHGVYLDHELNVQLFLFAHPDQAVEDLFP